MENASLLDQVKLAVLTSEVSWCAGIRSQATGWNPVALWGDISVDEISALLTETGVGGWLNGAQQSRRVRTRKISGLPAGPGLNRIAVFPSPEGANALLVGLSNGHLNQDSRAIFKSLSRKISAGFPDSKGTLTGLGEESTRAEFMRIAEQIGGLDITELDLESVLRRSVERSRELVGGSAAELGLIDTPNRSVRVLWSEVPGMDKVPYRVAMGEDVIGRVAELGEPLVVDDYPNWPERVLGNTGISSIVGVPLKYKDALIGTLTVVDKDPSRRFSGEDIRMLELLASQVSVSIRNARLFQELGDRIKAQRAAEGRIVEAARLAAIGEMAASIAHELNNPLTTINGFTELLMDEFAEGSRQREYMGLVLSEARRARDVVRRLLDFSRREEKMKGLVNLTEAISEVLALAGPMAQIQQVEIQFEAWEDLPHVFGDKSQLRQVMMNLVTNGIQAMATGGTLSIQTALESEPQEAVAIRVRDTGPGIPVEHQDQVFDPFFTTKPIGSGTGLGLSICRNIISEHGGQIRLESQIGKGSCFIVTLPPGRGPV